MVSLNPNQHAAARIDSGLRRNDGVGAGTMVMVNEMTTRQQNPELRRAVGTLATRVQSLETQAKSLVDGQRELRGRFDRLLYAILGVGTAVIAAMVINQALG